MAFDLHIKNISKLTDARLRIGRFTVLAGPNNTGKSYVSKILYSLFDAMNANPAEVYIDNFINPLWKSLIRLGYSEQGKALLSPLRKKIKALHTLVMQLPVGDVEELDKIIPDLAKMAKKMRAGFQDIRLSVKSRKMEEDEGNVAFPPLLFAKYVDDIEHFLSSLETNLSDMDAKNFITSGIKYKIRENLIQNFQVPNLAGLSGREDMPSKVEIKNFGTFEFSNGRTGLSIDHALLQELQQFSSVIYLESPVHWKLKNALENLRIRPRTLPSGRERLSGVPGYFYDLASALKSEYTGDIDFPDVYENLTGKNVLGGKIVISETGALLFQENARSYRLPVTATGVVNLGILALLIERKVLDRNAFVFIDEPEAHLHPSWQVEMAESLFALAKGGANVVIATHSVNILKWLEVHVKEYPEDEQLVALNKFPVHEGENDERDFSDKLADIREALAEPFADLYMQGL